MIDTTPIQQPRRLYVWHDRVHAIREAAKLQFWRLSFIPEYARDDIFETLHQTFSRFGISSYIVYETLGSFDLLLRLWVPRDHDPEDLALAFESALRPHTLWATEFQVVTAVERHWLWTPEAPLAAQTLPSEDNIRRITNGMVTELNLYNDATLSSSTSDVLPDPPAWTKEFEVLGLLAPLPLDKRGIRFFITFDHPARSYRRDQRADVLQRITAKCQQLIETIKRDYNPTEHPELSLYSGYGTMTDFLITARAPAEVFDEFLRGLIFGLRDIGLDRLYNIRPYTHVIAGRNYAEFREFPMAPEVVIDNDVLDQEEGEALEFKSTYVTDLRRYLATGEAVRSEVLQDAVVRTICGFLNSRRGGALVVGVMQVDRELERLKGNRAAVWESIQREFLIHSQSGHYEPGDSATKAIVGLEFEFSSGVGFNDWDTFVQHFERTVADRISPSPLPFLSVSQLHVKSQTLAVISVRPSLTQWFYADVKEASRFFVRELASTREYTARDAELYREAVPRSSSSPRQ